MSEALSTAEKEMADAAGLSHADYLAAKEKMFALKAKTASDGLFALADKIEAFLETMKDMGTHIDRGTDFQSRDLWVFVQGVEWHINIECNLERV
jgi:hypothetical protein